MFEFRAHLDNSGQFSHLNIFKVMTSTKAFLYKVTFTGSREGPDVFGAFIWTTADIVRFKYGNGKGLRLRLSEM